MCIKHVEQDSVQHHESSPTRADVTGQESMPVTFNVMDVKTINTVINQTAERNTLRGCF